MTQKMTLAFALALAAALPVAAEAQGRGRGNGKSTPPGQLCRAEGGTSNSRACRERYGDQNRKRDGRWDDRDTDSDGRWDRTRTSRRTRTSNGGICIDRNRDGFCDSGTSASRTDRDRDGIPDTRDSCVDRDRDGRCEATSSRDGGWGRVGDVIAGGSRYPTSGGYPTSGRYPGSLPLMSYAQRFASGERPSAVRQWLGTYDVRVRYADRNRDGRAESATWLSPSGTVLQVWQDVNNDGRADRVRVYERGRVVRTIQ